MKTIEEFLSQHNTRGSACPFSSSLKRNIFSMLREEMLETINRGLTIFPVPEFVKLIPQPDLPFCEATSDISRLEELAAMYPLCTWRAIVGSKLCVVRLDGLEGRAWFAAKCQEQGDCLTLTAVRGDMLWAIFHWPKGLVLCASAKKLVPGVTILADGDSFPIPPSGGCTWANPRAEIEAIPYWLREFAFDAPNNSPGNAAPMPTPSPRTVFCRSGFRVSRRR